MDSLFIAIWLFGFGACVAFFSIFSFIFAHKNKESEAYVVLNVVGICGVLMAAVIFSVFLMYINGYGFIF